MDLRKSLFGNIVLSGGSTLTKGFGDRLLQELQRLAVKDMRIKIFAPPERKYSTWICGIILAGLSTFRKVALCIHAARAVMLISIRCGSIKKIGTRILKSFIQNSTKLSRTISVTVERNQQTAETFIVSCIYIDRQLEDAPVALWSSRGISLAQACQALGLQMGSV